MLVKCAFVMQKLKKHPKKFCHDQQRWGGQILDFMGDTAVMRGGHRAHGGSPQSPPLGKTLPTEKNLRSFWGGIWGTNKEYNTEVDWVKLLDKEYC